MCTEEEEIIDSMVDAFRARCGITLLQLMEVDAMHVSMDRFSQGQRDSQDLLVPVSEERPYKYRSQASEDLLRRMGLLDEEVEEDE